MKTCKTCSEEKPLSEYYLNWTKKGYFGTCKACCTKRTLEWRRANRDKTKIHARRHRVHSYGADYNEAVELARLGCAICGEQESNGRELSVDHDHETGEWRGMLCGRCNRGLGYFRDDPLLLFLASEYLEWSRVEMEQNA